MYSKMTPRDSDFVSEVLKACKSELSAMEDTYDEYVVSGHLMEQIEEAIRIVEGQA